MRGRGDDAVSVQGADWASTQYLKANQRYQNISKDHKTSTILYFSNAVQCTLVISMNNSKPYSISGLLSE